MEPKCLFLSAIVTFVVIVLICPENRLPHSQPEVSTLVLGPLRLWRSTEYFRPFWAALSGHILQYWDVERREYAKGGNPKMVMRKWTWYRMSCCGSCTLSVISSSQRAICSQLHVPEHVDYYLVSSQLLEHRECMWSGCRSGLIRICKAKSAPSILPITTTWMRMIISWHLREM
jgi:hypothetical protein